LREERGELKHEFFDLPARRMVEKRVKMGDRDISYLFSLLDGLGDLRGVILKLLVEVEEHRRAKIDATSLLRALDARGVYDVYLEIESERKDWIARRVDRVYRDVVEAFEEYVAAQRLKPEFMKEVLMKGREILEKTFRE